MFDAEGLDEGGSVTIDVLPVNDAPQAQDASFVTNEGSPLWISLVELASDAETPYEQLVFTFTNVIGGTVTQIDPYTAVFTPLEDYVGVAGFHYTVADDGTPPLNSTAAVAIAINSLAESNGSSLLPELESAVEAVAAAITAA